MKNLTLPFPTCLVFLFGVIEPAFARFHRDEIPAGIPWIFYLIVGAVIFYVIKSFFDKK
jgi:hypothetical protein